MRNEFGREPTDGLFFVYVNGRRDRVKILHWERDGIELWNRGLEQGTTETRNLFIVCPTPHYTKLHRVDGIQK